MVKKKKKNDNKNSKIVHGKNLQQKILKIFKHLLDPFVGNSLLN